jgi:two-component system sensor histidine kinase BaeS
MAQEKGVHLDTELATELEVVGDPVRLRQVVRNLLDNAIRYTPAGGAIHVTLHGEAGEACLQVIDNGSGIAAADLPYIFDSFYRTDEARNRQQGGTGLGLAIARRWSNVHAGRITVASQLGLGSTFTLWLPLAVVS